MAFFSYVSLILFIIVIGIIASLLVLYPKYYRSKVNKSLKDKQPVRAIEPTVLYVGILLAIIIIFNIAIVSSNKQFQTDLRNLQSDIRTLESNNQFLINQLLDLNEDVSIAISEGEFVQYIEFEVLGEDDSISGMYDVKLSFYITENVLDQDLVLYVESDNGTETFDLTETQTRHNVNLELYLSKDYTIYVKDENSADGTKHDLLDFNLYNYLYDRFNIQFDLEYENSAHQVTVFVSNYWENPSEGVPSGLMEIETVQVLVTDGSGNVIIDLLMDERVQSSHSQYFNLYEGLGERFDSLTIQVIITDNAGIEYTNY